MIGSRGVGAHAAKLASLVVALTFSVASVAHAIPQINAGVTIGGGAVVAPSDLTDGIFHLGLHSDVLFGRDDPRDLGLGPYVELLTADFASLDAGAGLTVLLPIHDTFPLMLSAGGAYSVREGGDDVVLATRVAWGSRSYNYHAVYGLAAVVFVDVRAGIDSGSVEIIGGASLDLALLVLPVLGLWMWIHGGDPDEPD